MSNVGNQIPPGTMVLWAGGAGQYAASAKGAIAMPGWLFCDGSIVNRSDYPALFAAIGVRYNTTGETSLQFRLPGIAGYMAKATTTSTNSEHVLLTTNHVHNVTVGAVNVASVLTASDHSATHGSATFDVGAHGAHSHTANYDANGASTAGRGTGNQNGIGGTHTHGDYSSASVSSCDNAATHSSTAPIGTDTATHTHGNLSVSSAPTVDAAQTVTQPTIDLWHIIKI